MKKIYAIVLLFISTLVVILFFSETTKNYECTGSFQKNTTDKVIFLKHKEYRFWVGLWSESKGMLWIEIPGKDVDAVTKIKKVGNSLQLYGYSDEIKGHFSTLSKFISIKISNDFYDGQCKKIK
jgi:hypothetical protein